MHKEYLFGIDRVLSEPKLTKEWGRCALLFNQASVDKTLTYSSLRLQELLKERLVCLFSPQHGPYSTEQDNMIETGHHTDPFTGLHVHSLYSERRKPTLEMLSHIDTLIIDIQIVGCRVYTFKKTIYYCLEACKEAGKRLIILDRPNPLGGQYIEGPCLDPEMRSFVGPYEMPMRHGLTPGEVAELLNREIGADLSVITMKGWEPNKVWDEQKRTWVMTSPNLPHLKNVLAYPGFVALEGTNISEGRGTAQPFLLLGAPYIKDPKHLAAELNKQYKDYGIILQPLLFQPTFNKWKGETCGGLLLHISNPIFPSFSLGMSFLKLVLNCYPESFKWVTTPYEYEFSKLPIDLILGKEGINQHVKNFNPLDTLWTNGLEQYITRASQVLLYERNLSIL